MMFEWILLQLMLFGIFNAGETIFCGTPVPPSERSRFSYLVEILHFGTEGIECCAGAIIDAAHILTAAHCFSNPFDGDTLIIAGVVHLNSILRLERAVSKIHVHEEFDHYWNACRKWGGLQKWIRSVCPCMKEELAGGCQLKNDIAVLKLSEDLPVGRFIRAINLPENDFLPHCDISHYAGWGQTEIDGAISEKLFSIPMMILTDQDCRARGARLFFNQFCAMDPLQQACPLKGDSGAPLVFNNTIYGVGSTGRKHPAFPNIFSKVFDHLNFIKRVLEN